MITIEQYFFNPTKRVMKQHTGEQAAAADALLEKVNALLDRAEEEGVFERTNNPHTGCEISGSLHGAGDGGFRAPDSGTGAAHSNHRIAHAVDVYDPGNKLDDWLTDEILAEFGLYREHPDSTDTWCHLQDVPPHSGHRTYLPA